MKTINLSGEKGKGKFVIVDDEDFENLNKYSWNIHPQGYATRFMKRMHRVIMNCPQGMVIDHINGDKLDNRKENLRICTQLENSRNKRSFPKNTSGYRGVSFDKNKGKFRAFIWVNGKNKSLGYFKNAIEASKVYIEANKKYFGKFGGIFINDIIKVPVMAT
jgi:hypothetical protein